MQGTVQEQRDLIDRLEADLSLVQPYLPAREEGEGQASIPANLLSEALKVRVLSILEFRVAIKSVAAL